MKIVDRKYLIGDKWFRFKKMKGSEYLGFKIAIGRYEFRFYKKNYDMTKDFGIERIILLISLLLFSISMLSQDDIIVSRVISVDIEKQSTTIEDKVDVGLNNSYLFKTPYIDLYNLKYDISTKPVISEITENGSKYLLLEFYNINKRIINIYYQSNISVIDIELQSDKFISDIKVSVINKSVVDFNIDLNDRSPIKINSMKKGDTIVFFGKDIKPLSLEPNVINYDVYKQKITFEFTNLWNTHDVSQWKDLNKWLFVDNNFKNNVYQKDIYQKDIEKILKSNSENLSDKQKTKIVYDFIKHSIQWDGIYSILPIKGTVSTYNDKSGSSSDINILFMSILKSLGIKSYPILVSTRSNGDQSIKGKFNYLITGSYIDDKLYLFDLSKKDSEYDMVSSDLINWKGSIYENGKFKEVELSKSFRSQKDIIIDCKIENNTLSGVIKERRTGYYMFENFEENNNFQKKEIINITQMDTLVSRTYNFESSKKSIRNSTDNEKIFINPLIHLSYSDIPFLSETRNFDIEFEFPHRDQYMVIIDIPDGYEIESLPNGFSESTADSSIEYSFYSSFNKDRVQSIIRFSVNSSIISKEHYDEIRNLYLNRLKKESEQLIFSKK